MTDPWTPDHAETLADLDLTDPAMANAVRRRMGWPEKDHTAVALPAARAGVAPKDFLRSLAPPPPATFTSPE